MRIHFISGLPRAGSTLLAAILRQNPKFSAGMSSPVAHLLNTLQKAMSGGSEFHALIDDRIRRSVLKGVVESFYDEFSPDTTIFDTNRDWCCKLPTMMNLFPQAKILCCVRSLAWVFDSFERIVRRNSLEPSRLFDFQASNNVYMRVEALNNPRTGVVGRAFGSLREAVYGEFSGNLLLIRYESLCQNPESTMVRVYELLREAQFRHNFDDLSFDSSEFDRRLGARDLHRVHGRVRWAPRATVLPPELFAQFDRMSFWDAPDFACRHVTVI